MILRATGLLILIAAFLPAQGTGPSDRLSQQPGQPQIPEVPKSADALTLDEALALAEKYNPQLHVAAAQTEGANAGILTAKAYPNPEFNILTGEQYSRWFGGRPGPPGVLQHYSFSQPIELPSVRKSRINAAELGRESSLFALDQSRIAVRAAVKQAFYQVLRRKREVELAQENLKLIEDLRRRIQVQVDVGEAARLELTRADAEVATAQTFSNSARLRLLTAISGLRAVMNAPPNVTISPQGTLDRPPPLPSLDEVKKEVLARHPALAQAQAEIQRAEARLKNERALRAPQPSLRGEYEQQPDLGFYRLGVTLPVPLWNRRKGPIAEAEAAVNQATAMAEMRRVELAAALEREVIEGQNVKRGQVLATVHSTQLSNEQFAFVRAVSQQKLAQQAVTRATQLLKADVIGTAEQQRREAELLQASAELSATRDQLKVLGMSDEAIEKLETTRSVNSTSNIVSSIEGTVLDRRVTSGQVVQPAETIFIVADLSHVWLVADVPEQSAGSITIGKSVEAEIAALPGQTITGTLSFVSAIVSPETRTVRIRMNLPNPHRRYKPAMLASMVLKDGVERQQVVLATAVVREENQDHVFVQTAANTFVLRRVTLGAAFGDTRVVTDGLKTGEKIVLNGAFHLNNERKRLALQGEQ